MVVGEPDDYAAVSRRAIRRDRGLHAQRRGLPPVHAVEFGAATAQGRYFFLVSVGPITSAVLVTTRPAWSVGCGVVAVGQFVWVSGGLASVK